MPGVDWIPGVSQLKSVCQFVTGDAEGAAKTQENFAKECPVVSQVTSVVQVCAGNTAGALETQQRCLGTINNVANGIPVVGHIKGGVHHAFGDHEGGNQALLAATRSSVVVGSGIAAGIVSGGLAAIPTAIAAGSAYDIADSSISDKPKGVCAVVKNAIDNPNAGNIFDATAMFVGDGLAGYSGGQIGTKLKLNSLDAARAAKNEQLIAGMFPEKGVSPMSSGQANILGQEISAITSEMHALQHGTPQNWFDPKTQQVVIENSASGAKVVIVNVTPEDVENITQKYGYNFEYYFEGIECYREENGLEADCYAGVIEDALSPQEKAERKSNYENTNSTNQPLTNQYRKTIIIDRKWETLKNNLKGDNNPRRNLTKENKELLAKLTWLHVPMPQEFGFTGAILANDTRSRRSQGLLHTFARHYDQWEEHIPGLSALRNKLPARILELLKNVKDATEVNCENAFEALNKEIKKLQNETDIIVDLIDIQMKLHEFMVKNITYAKYLEETINNKGKIQVNFQVSKTRVMVVCVSDQLYPIIDEFDNSRPVRTITTVFFKTMAQYDNSKNKIGKAWKKK